MLLAALVSSFVAGEDPAALAAGDAAAKKRQRRNLKRQERREAEAVLLPAPVVATMSPADLEARVSPVGDLVAVKTEVFDALVPDALHGVSFGAGIELLESDPGTVKAIVAKLRGLLAGGLEAHVTDEDAAGAAMRDHLVTANAYGPEVDVFALVRRTENGRVVGKSRPVILRGRLSAFHRSCPDALTRDARRAVGVFGTYQTEVDKDAELDELPEVTLAGHWVPEQLDILAVRPYRGK